MSRARKKPARSGPFAYRRALVVEAACLFALAAEIGKAMQIRRLGVESHSGAACVIPYSCNCSSRAALFSSGVNAMFVISHQRHASSRRWTSLTQTDDFAMAVAAVVIVAIVLFAWLMPPSALGLG